MADKSLKAMEIDIIENLNDALESGSLEVNFTDPISVNVLNEVNANITNDEIVSKGDLHEYIHKGIVFTSASLLTIAEGASAYALIKTGSQYLHYKPTRYESNGNDILIQFFENQVTTSDGSEITTIKNRRLGSTLVAREFKIFLNPVVTNDGSIIDIFLIGGGTALGQNRSGGSSAAGEEWLFPPNKSVLVKYTNRGVASAQLAISSLSYEMAVD